MSKKIKISELTEFDAAEYLTCEEDIAAYLTTVIDENDSSLLAAALGDIARAQCQGLRRNRTSGPSCRRCG